MLLDIFIVRYNINCLKAQSSEYVTQLCINKTLSVSEHNFGRYNVLTSVKCLSVSQDIVPPKNPKFTVTISTLASTGIGALLIWGLTILLDHRPGGGRGCHPPVGNM